MTGGRDARFEALLDHLRRTRGIDLTGYKRSSLRRRVTKRLQRIGIDDCLDYVDYLEVHPEEFPILIDTILINVTSFFRDEPTWDYLRQVIVPRMLESKQPHDPVRVWSAGCASGEEAYSLAMVLAEALGVEEFQKRVRIYASDVDEGALTQARAAAYRQADLDAIPGAMRAKYFVPQDDRFGFRGDLRRSIIFGRHDLVQDAPISRLDLLVCRNVLMYLNTMTRSSILARFHLALNDGGALVLGKAEVLLTCSGLFTPTDLRYRVFRKAPRTSLGDRLLVMTEAGDTDAAGSLGRQVRARESVFDAGPVAQLVVDANGTVVLINERLRAMFGLDPCDAGKPLEDLEIAHRPAELPSLIERARSERRSVKVERVERRLPGGDLQYLTIEVTPLRSGDDGPWGMSISFDDVTQFQHLQADLQRRTVDWGQPAGFLHSILAGIMMGVIVLDRNLRVLIWNHRAEEFWGLREDEVKGRSILSLEIGLPIRKLHLSMLATLEGEQDCREVFLPARNGRGEEFECAVTCTALGADPGCEPPGLVLLMRDRHDTIESAPPGAALSFRETRREPRRRTGNGGRKR